MNAVAHDLSLPLDELYEYDELARLVAARRGLLSTSPSLSLASVGFEQAWGLDGLGNFATFQEDADGQGWDLEQERDVNAANEITGIDEGQYQDAWITPQYDAAGNMIVGPAPGDESARLHFVYDAWNRLVKVYADDAQNPGEPGDVVAQYTYDGQKRRIEKLLADGTSIEYYYNANWQLLEERFLDESQEPTGADQYVWSPRYIDAPILRDHYDDEGELDAAARLYYLGDANFNVTALVGLEEVEPGVLEWQVTERYAYDPYGKAVVYDADWANPTAQTSDGPLYAGYMFDPETGLYDARNRLYHSTLATWIIRDPIGYAAGDANLYRYVANSPAVHIDPFGLERRKDVLISGNIIYYSAEIGRPTFEEIRYLFFTNGDVDALLTGDLRHYTFLPHAAPGSNNYDMRRGEWIAKLELSRATHTDYEYYAAFNIGSAYDKLADAIRTYGGLRFNTHASLDENTWAQFQGGQISVRGSFADAGLDTIVHESVHVYVELHGVARFQDPDEAYAHTLTHLLEGQTLGQLVLFENKVKREQFRVDISELTRDWNAIWSMEHGLPANVSVPIIAWIDLFGFEHSRPGTIEDVLKTQREFGISVSCARLRERYVDLLVASGYARDEAEGCLRCPANLPDYFR